MAFKIRDLMITDLTASEGTHLRLGTTGSRCSGRTCDTRYTCGYSSITRETTLCGVGFGSDPAQLLEQLAQLKAQLKAELAEVEKEEAALEAHLLPGSLAEVEDLQLKLAAATEELAQLKVALEKKPA